MDILHLKQSENHGGFSEDQGNAYRSIKIIQSWWTGILSGNFRSYY